MRKEKRVNICLIKAGNAVNNGIMDKFSNEKLEHSGNPALVSGQANFKLFNLCIGFCKAFYYINAIGVVPMAKLKAS